MSTETFVIAEIATIGFLIAVTVNFSLWLLHQVARSGFALVATAAQLEHQAAFRILESEVQDLERFLAIAESRANESATVRELAVGLEQRLDRVDASLRAQRAGSAEGTEESPAEMPDEPSWNFDPYAGPRYEGRRVGPVRPQGLAHGA